MGPAPSVERMTPNQILLPAAPAIGVVLPLVVPAVWMLRQAHAERVARQTSMAREIGPNLR